MDQPMTGQQLTISGAIDDGRGQRRRTRMNSTPPVSLFNRSNAEPTATTASPAPRQRRRLLSTGDIFERLRGTGMERADSGRVLDDKERPYIEESTETCSTHSSGSSDVARKGKEKSFSDFRSLLRRASVSVRGHPIQHSKRPSQSCLPALHSMVSNGQSMIQPARPNSQGERNQDERDETRHRRRPSPSASLWTRLRNPKSSNRLNENEEKEVHEPGHPYHNNISESERRNSRERGQPQQLTPFEQALQPPIPGMAGVPPYIPERTGGEAARAQAAAQNEMLETLRRAQEADGDNESAVSLTFTPGSSAHNPFSLPQDGSRPKAVDFTEFLPAEIFAHIFSELAAKDLIRCARVSKHWHNIMQTPAIWQTSFYRERTKTFSLGHPIVPGSGKGIPVVKPNTNWKRLYSASQLLAENWKGEGLNRAVYLLGHTDSVYCLQFDEHKIVTGSRDRTIRIWSMHDLRCYSVIAPPAYSANKPDNWTEEGNHKGRGRQSAATFEPEVCSHDIHHTASVLCLQYDDSIMVTGASDHTAIVHSMTRPHKPLHHLRFHTSAVLDVAFNKEHIVTASKDSQLAVWSRRSGQLLKVLDGHHGPVNSVQLNGDLVVSCSGDFSVRLWSISSGLCIKELTKHTKGLACSQISKDGKWIASAGNDKVIRIWNAATGECIRVWEAHDGLIRSLWWDDISSRLISAGYDETVCVWEMGDLAVREGKTLLRSELKGWHSSWVLAAKSDYRRLLSAGQDGKVLVMDFGELIKDVEGLESGGVDADGSICKGGLSDNRNWGVLQRRRGGQDTWVRPS